MKFTAVFIGNGKPVARVEGMTPLEAQAKCDRLAQYGGAFQAELFQGAELVAVVSLSKIRWVAGSTAWARLLEDDDL